MAQLSSVYKQIAADYPQFLFKEAAVSRWSLVDNTVYFQPIITKEELYSLFHELGHGIRRHQDYDQDIELLRIENEAWQEATVVAARYGYTIDDTTVETALDGYREWLHARSRCPACGSSGLQLKASGTYGCVLCQTKWKTNDARQCGLKRYIKK